MSPSARSLILDLLSTLRSGSMPVRALVASGALFQIAENNIRVTLARLCADDRVERDARGLYCLAERTRSVQRQLRAWRRLRDRVESWDRSWIGVHAALSSGSDAAARRRGERALRFMGFRALMPGLHVRPNNLEGRVERTRQQLLALGLANTAVVFRLQDLAAETERRARGLWHGQALADRYREGLASLDRSRARLPSLSTEGAMVETFRVGGRVLRMLAFDPLLPEPIADPRLRETLAGAMRSYDRLGRSCWADFFGRYDVPCIRDPVGLQFGEGVGMIATAGGCA